MVGLSPALTVIKRHGRVLAWATASEEITLVALVAALPPAHGLADTGFELTSTTPGV